LPNSKHISLKWKAFIFQFLVLTLLTLAWAWVTTNKQINIFNEEVIATHKEHTTILNSSIDDSLEKLAQHSQLIANEVLAKFPKNDFLPPRPILLDELNKQWLQIHGTLSVDFISLYDYDQKQIVEKKIKNNDFVESFYKTVEQNILSSKDDGGESQRFIFCEDDCYFVVVERFITEKRKQGFIVGAQNITPILKSYYNFTSENLGILVAGDDLTDTVDRAYLQYWELRPWAISHFNNTFSVIEHYSQQNKLTLNSDNSMFIHDDKRYLVKEIQINKNKLLGQMLHFVAVSDKTKNYQTLTNNIKRGVIFGVFALLFSSLVLRQALKKPINKLKEIGDALNLIPKNKFSKALVNLNNEPKFPDEISQLETSTSKVVEKLQDMHKEIDKKNKSLNEQVIALSRSQSFLKRLFENSQNFIVTQKFDSTILSSNKKFDSLFVKSQQSFKNLLDSHVEKDKFEQQLEQLKQHQTKVFQHEVSSVDVKSKAIVISWTHSIIEGTNGDEIVLSIGMDQTQQKNAENNLRWLANHDNLTGIGNRRAFHSAFKKVLDKNENGVLLFLDVNKFKQINDIFSHNAGDKVLIEISETLAQLTTEKDSIYRFAGDEFTVLLNSIKQENLECYLNKLSDQLNTNIKLDNGQTISYSTSIGAALFSAEDDANNDKKITANADLAMYNAKQKGLGFWHIYNPSDEQVMFLKKEHDVMLSIKHAIEHQTFNLEFQPILNIETNTVSHYEALLRLKDKNGKKVSPALFIPVAEKTGEIRAIDEWVVENCFMILSELNKQDCNPTFSINISTPTLQSSNFAEFLFHQVKHYGIKPSNILIELTETAYIQNFSQVKNNLKIISDYGFKLALDDFGVGFSSFDYLKQLPLDYVKLDGSYIKNIEKNKDDQVFVKSLNEIVNAFDMQTIAEYVENETILDIVTKLGVAYAQGYHISKPINKQDFLKQLLEK